MTPLGEWFAALAPAASAHGGVLVNCNPAARELLTAPSQPVELNGGIHHGNVLDFGQRGWLAIDPKRLIGDRGFDYANNFVNPDKAHASTPIAQMPERFDGRLSIVTQASGIEPRRLLSWILASSGLSAAWIIAALSLARLSV